MASAEVELLRQRLADVGYLASTRVATVLYLALIMGKPLLVEGPAGVGKTFLSQAVAAVTATELIRLQCYDGLDESKALYEWNYQKQLLFIQHKSGSADWSRTRGEIFSEDFLLERPVLKALLASERTTLLIDEVDKGDAELESLLLEALAEFQVTIPEMGTIKARSRPQVVITSNGVRDLSDALRRRCLHLYLDYPEPDLERGIILSHLPETTEALARQVVMFVQRVRKQDLRKVPGISESIDWTRSLLLLGIDDLGGLSPEVLLPTLATLLKNRSDLLALEASLKRLLPAGGRGFGGQEGA